jgi:uncharacterized membrane protein HdeD (DUF308 family)
MARVTAWAILILGFIHVVFGVIRFKVPIAEAWAAGFIGQFMMPEIRRTTFWFIMYGPLLMLVGHFAIHAVEISDLKLLKLIGVYMLASSVVGVFSFPVSGFLVTLLLSLLLLAAGYDLIK